MQQHILEAVASTITVHPPWTTATSRRPHHTSHPYPHPAPSSTLPSHPGHGHHGGHHHPHNSNLVFTYDVANRSAHVALWVFFGVFAAAVVAVTYLRSRVAARQRIFHALSVLALTITASSYFLLATGVGIAPSRAQVPHEDPPIHALGSRGHGNHTGENGGHWHLRQTHWLQEAAHIFSIPLLVLQLALLAGLSPAAGLLAAVNTGFSFFFGAVSNHFANRTKFHPRAGFVGYAIVSLIFMVLTFWTLFIDGIGAARLRRSKTKGLYYMLTLHLFVTWALYSILFILGTGFNILGVTAEVIALGIVDIATIVGFVAVLLFLHVHDEEDPSFTFPAWFVENRGAEGGDGRGSYAAVAAE